MEIHRFELFIIGISTMYVYALLDCTRVNYACHGEPGIYIYIPQLNKKISKKYLIFQPVTNAVIPP